MRLQLDDQPAFEYSQEVGLPSTLSLDTTLWSNGVHRIAVSVDTAEGETLQDSVSLRFDNLPFRIASYRVAEFARNGAEATVDVEIQGSSNELALTADFSALDSGYVPGAEAVEPLSSSLYRIHYTVSAGNTQADGAKVVILAAADASGRAPIRRPISLSLRNTPPAPFQIAGATFIDAPALVPQPGASGALLILGAQRLHLVGDEPGALQLSWAGSSVPVERLILTFSGYAGYYILPVDPSQTEATVELFLPDSAPNAPLASSSAMRSLEARSGMKALTGGSTSGTSLSAFGQGSSGSTSSSTVGVTTTSVPPSVAQVTLRWSGAADSDLHVVEPGPSGQEIEYNNPVSSASGGTLSLDSNSHCVAAADPAESISWPEGAGPMSGTYKVRVVMYEGCAGDPDKKLTSPLSFSGQYIDCQGTAHPFSGTFPAGTAQQTSMEVATYDLQCPAWMHGRVSVQRLVPPSPLTLQSVDVPRVKIRALKSSDNSELAAGFTDQNGGYKLAFDPKGDKFFLQVEGEIDPSFASVVVQDGGRKLQFWKGPDLDPKGQPTAYDLAIADVPGATQRAGAFRLLENIQNAIAYGALVTGKDFKSCNCTLTIYWDLSAYAKYGSVYDKQNRFIRVQNGDENSPFRIVHEYFHFVMNTWSVDHSPGGDHKVSTRSTPTLAWSEGAATYYAFKTTGVPVVYAGAEDGFPLLQVDLYSPTIEQGAEPDSAGKVTQYGKVSEGMVTQMLWEMSAATGLVDAAIFQKMPSRFQSKPPDFTTSDPSQGADFVDFIDGLRGLAGAPSDADLKAILQGPPPGLKAPVHDMPYDFKNNSKI